MKTNSKPIHLDPSPLHITVADAAPEDVAYVLAGDPSKDDTRSQRQWFRFPNGDLVLGVFPQGDTYFGVTDRAGV